MTEILLTIFISVLLFRIWNLGCVKHDRCFSYRDDVIYFKTSWRCHGYNNLGPHLLGRLPHYHYLSGWVKFYLEQGFLKIYSGFISMDAKITRWFNSCKCCWLCIICSNIRFFSSYSCNSW